MMPFDILVPFSIVIFVFYVIDRASPSPPTRPTVFVNGTSTQRVQPELCDVSFRVTHEAASSDEAVTKVTQVANQLSSVLKGFTADKPEPSATGEPQVLDAEAPIVAGFPVTKWEMQRLRQGTRTVRIDDSTTQSQGGANLVSSFTASYGEETRTYANASFSATFHDFDALEKFVGSLMHEPLVEVDTLHWSVTTETRIAFTKTVRAPAIRDAILMACDYGGGMGLTGRAYIRDVEISNHSQNGGAPVLHGTMAGGPIGESAEHETLSFEPEPIEVTANVALKGVLS